jgi:pimeloyl-ACP methyl ester carboxylesterase
MRTATYATLNSRNIDMNSKTISIAGNNITYDTLGTGDPVLLLHGAFQTRYLWRNVAEALALKRTVVAPDLRGIGDSGAGDSSFDFKTVGAEMAALMQTLGHDRYALVGHDLGGGVSYALASQFSERITRFVFMDMLLPGFGFEEAWVPRPNGQFLWFAALNSVPGVVETLLKGREREYLEHVLRGGFTANKAGITDQDISAYASAYAKPGVLAALGGYFRAMWSNAEYNKSSATRKLTMPVLALGGEYSVGEGAAQSMKAVATDVNAAIVSGSGHWLTEENPKDVIKLLSQFLITQN